MQTPVLWSAILVLYLTVEVGLSRTGDRRNCPDFERPVELKRRWCCRHCRRLWLSGRCRRLRRLRPRGRARGGHRRDVLRHLDGSRVAADVDQISDHPGGLAVEVELVPIPPRIFAGDREGLPGAQAADHGVVGARSAANVDRLRRSQASNGVGRCGGRLGSRVPGRGARLAAGSAVVSGCAGAAASAVGAAATGATVAKTTGVGVQSGVGVKVGFGVLVGATGVGCGPIDVQPAGRPRRGSA